MYVTVILLAGGNGTRMNNKCPKQLMTINGKTILDIVIHQFLEINLVTKIILVILEKEFENIQRKYDNKKIKIIKGGSTRFESSSKGLKQVENNTDYILIHDVARPFVPKKIIYNCVKYLQEGFDCCAPYLNSTNSLLQYNNSKNKYSYINRANIKNIQTPSAFKKDIIINSELHSSQGFTDHIGKILTINPNTKLKLFLGSKKNFKITYPEDFLFAESLMNNMNQISQLNFNGNKKKALVFGGNSGIGASIAEHLKLNNVEVTISNSKIRIQDDDLSQYKNINWDIIVNSIGTITTKNKKSLINLFENINLDEFNYAIETNFKSCIKISKLALKTMINGGHLLFIGSSSVKKGRKNFSVYSSTKMAIVSLTQSLAEEFLSKNIMVNCLHPSRTNTKMRNVFNNKDNQNMLLASEVGRVAMGFCNGNITGQNFFLKVGDIVD